MQRYCGSAPTQTEFGHAWRGNVKRFLWIVVDGTDNQHEAVIKLVRKYRGDLEEFGNIGFEIRNTDDRAGRKTEYATLNEQQSTLLLTYMRNSGIVRQFKKALVKAFWELKNNETAGPRAPCSLASTG